MLNVLVQRDHIDDDLVGVVGNDASANILGIFRHVVARADEFIVGKLEQTRKTGKLAVDRSRNAEIALVSDIVMDHRPCVLQDGFDLNFKPLTAKLARPSAVLRQRADIVERQVAKGILFD